MEGVIILSRPSDRRMMPPRQCSSPSFLLPLASLGKYVVGVQFSLVSCESQSQELLLGCKHVISERGARGSPGQTFTICFHFLLFFCLLSRTSCPTTFSIARPPPPLHITRLNKCSHCSRTMVRFEPYGWLKSWRVEWHYHCTHKEYKEVIAVPDQSCVANLNHRHHEVMIKL